MKNVVALTWEREKARLRRFYRLLFLQHQEPAQRVGWRNAESQKQRFNVFVDLLPDPPRGRLLDFGCGTGDFFGFLEERGLQENYIGVDVLKWNIQEAKKRYPRGKFEVRDLSQKPFPRHFFDTAVLSGVFNFRLFHMEQWVKSWLKMILYQTRRRVIFNVLHGEAVREPGRFSLSPFEAWELARSLPGVRAVRLFDHYQPNDLTVLLQKD